MAQEIMVAGAIYEDVPSVRLPDSHGTFHPFTDTSDTTAVAADVAQGKTFHLADGTAATGTAAGATLVTKSITANGTYSAEDDGADGYSDVTVNVSSGGGSVEPKDVNFIDYDGTVLHSYTAAEFAELTAMPSNPSSEGLVAQGWNWTLSDAQSYVASYGFLTIGQMYATASGDTEIDIDLRGVRLSPCLGFAVNGTAKIDWGDGTPKDTVSGVSDSTVISTPHVYASSGKYTIVVSVLAGQLTLMGGTAFCILHKSTESVANENVVYACAVTAVRISEDAGVGIRAFNGCKSLEYVTFPHEIGSIPEYVFSGAGITGFTVPSGVTSIGRNSFNACASMKRISIPASVATIGREVFSSCTQLESLELPESVSKIEFNMGSALSNLASFAMPKVSTIVDNAMSNFQSLTVLKIPANTTKIGGYGVSGFTGLKELHFLRDAIPPTLTAKAFNALPTDCKIYVPTGSLSAYTSASNYPSSSTYTYVEE